MSDEHKAMVVIQMYQWGYKNPSITYRAKQRIARAAVNLVAYDNGYRRLVSPHTVVLWEIRMSVKLDTGDHASTNRIGSTSYVGEIEKRHPGYLHFLYRYAVRTFGAKSGFGLLASVMNERSDTPGESRTSLNLSRRQLNAWFLANLGKEHSPKEKPLDTPHHKRLRLQWVREHYHRITNPYIPVAY